MNAEKDHICEANHVNSLKTKCSTNKKALYAFGVFVSAFLIMAIVYIIKMANVETPVVDSYQTDENLVPNIPIKTDIDKVLLISKTLRTISRKQWLAQPASGPMDTLKTPAPYVVITHTATENCSDQASCTFHVRYIQTFHIESQRWSDIGYNFLVGGDGSVYEGRGWDTVGAHTKGYNARSIGIALVGTFNTILPPERQLKTTQQLIELGVALGKIAKDYKLFGHRQLIPTLSPGDVLFNEIKKWPHFADSQ